MTAQEAEKLGYQVVRASPSEVGITKNGEGIRTWWAKDFEGKLPALEHPLILKAIETHEVTGERNAFCQLCGDKITWSPNRLIWLHVDSTPRHPARPRTMPRN